MNKELESIIDKSVKKRIDQITDITERFLLENRDSIKRVK